MCSVNELTSLSTDTMSCDIVPAKTWLDIRKVYHGNKDKTTPFTSQFSEVLPLRLIVNNLPW